MIEDIFETYSMVNHWFDKESTLNQSGGHVPWNRMRELNDYAYFVLLFTQLEDHVNDKFQTKRDQNYETERQYSGDTDFKVKVNEVFKKRPKIRKLIGQYYEIRNDIAHGRITGGLFLKYIRESSIPITVERLHADIHDLLKYDS